MTAMFAEWDRDVLPTLRLAAPDLTRTARAPDRTHAAGRLPLQVRMAVAPGAPHARADDLLEPSTNARAPRARHVAPAIEHHSLPSVQRSLPITRPRINQLNGDRTRATARVPGRDAPPRPPGGAPARRSHGDADTSDTRGERSTQEATGTPECRASLSTSKRPSKQGAWNIATANIHYGCDPIHIAVMVEKHNLDLVALTEVRMAETKSLTLYGTGTHVMWQGFPKAESAVTHERGVGWAYRVNGEGAPRIKSVQWYGPRVSALHTSWGKKNVPVTFIGIYAPTGTKSEKEEFAAHLGAALRAAPRGETIIMGDTNAHLGWKHDDPRCPKGSRWWAELLEDEDMIVTNYDSMRSQKQMTTFKMGHLPNIRDARVRRRVLDVIAAPRAHRESVRGTRPVVMCYAGADHRLVRARFRPTWRSKRKDAAAPPSAAPQPATASELTPLWNEMVQKYATAAREEPTTPYRITFLSPEARVAVEHKAFCWNAHKAAPCPNTLSAYKDARTAAKRSLRLATEEYWKTWATTVTSHINEGKPSAAFAMLRPRYKPRPVKLPSGDIDGCRAHFAKLLGPTIAPGRDEDEARWARLRSAERLEVNDREPTDAEVRKALVGLSNSSPGKDKINARGLKAKCVAEVAALVRECWRQGTVPPAFQEAVLVALPKKTGAKSWDEHRGITLLCVPSKVLTRVMLARLKEADLLVEQCGFRSGCGTADAIVAVKSVMDQAVRVGARLVFTFVDLAKAYDTIPRGLVWDTLRRVGAGPRMMRVLQALYHDRIFVRSGKDTSPEPFASTQGVRQGCLLSPLLFNLVFDRVLRTVYDRIPGIRLGGQVMKFRAYADDLVIVSGTREQAQKDIDAFQEACLTAGLTLSTDKTKIMQLSCVQAGGPAERDPETAGVPVTPDGQYYMVVNGPTNCPVPGCQYATEKTKLMRTHLEKSHHVAASVMSAEPTEALVPSMREEGGMWICCICGKVSKHRPTIGQHAKKEGCLVRRWVDGQGHALRTRELLGVDKAEARRRLGVEPGPGEPDVISAISPDGRRVPLEDVDEFTYLGRLLTADNSEVACIDARIRAANTSANALYRRNRLKHAARSVRVMVFNTVSKAQLCYAGQTWYMTQACRDKLDKFHRKWLRRITGLGPKLVDDVLRYPRDADVYTAAGVKYAISDELDVHRLRFFGHTLRRPSAITANIELPARIGTKDSTTLRGQLLTLAEAAGLPAGDLTELRAAAQNRAGWREKVNTYRETRHDVGTGGHA